MAILNATQDPEYRPSPAGFAQHTYAAQQQYMPQQYYWNGQAIQPVFQQQTVGAEPSRRNDAPPQPTVAAPTLGFNQLAEQSRRNMMPMPQQQPQVQFQAQQQVAPQTTSPWAAQPQQQMPTMPVYGQQMASCNPEYSALYNFSTQLDRKQSVWDTTTTYTPVVAPVVNWAQAQQAPQMPAPQVTYLMCAAYPAQVQQPMQPNWEQMAKINFGVTD